MINGHGGNIYQLAQELKCQVTDIVDMSSNVNPLGPMPQLLTHLSANLDKVAYLPQADATAIRTAFADYHGIEPQRVFAGNGSTQWIYMLPLALKSKRALILGPTYADYADACAMHNTQVSYLLSSSENHFDFDLKKAARMASDADIIFICNPNNPTGRLISAEAILELCQTCPNTIFVIDESYLPFVADSKRCSLVGHKLENAVIINSMSKIFRLPGLRIGFFTVPEKLIERFEAYSLPWAVNNLAVEAVLWLMTNKGTVRDFIEDSIDFIGREKELFYSRTAQVPGLTCFDSCTSYILVRLPETIKAQTVWDAMAQERLLIRDCSNFFGLNPQYIRISLKDPKNNLKAAELLNKLCGQ